MKVESAKRVKKLGRQLRALNEIKKSLSKKPSHDQITLRDPQVGTEWHLRNSTLIGVVDFFLEQVEVDLKTLGVEI